MTRRATRACQSSSSGTTPSSIASAARWPERGRADREQRDDPREPARDHHRPEQAEARAAALDRGDAAHETDPEHQEDAREIAEMAVEIGPHRRMLEPGGAADDAERAEAQRDEAASAAIA